MSNKERLEELRRKAEDHKVAFMYDGHCSKLGKEEIEKRLKNKEPYVIRQKMPRNRSLGAYMSLICQIITRDMVLEVLLSESPLDGYCLLYVLL